MHSSSRDLGLPSQGPCTCTSVPVDLEGTHPGPQFVGNTESGTIVF